MTHVLIEALAGAPSPFARAVRGGAGSDRVAHAFAAGYQAALCALVPSLAADGVATLAASEAGGAHPRAIATRLAARGDAWVLDGRKTFATRADEAQVLLVLAAATAGGEERAALKLVQVRAGAPGLTIVAGAPLPFCPEIQHSSVELASVPVAPSDVLEGDGWADYVRPFRTVEDVHVHAAVLAYVLAVGLRAGWPRPAREELAALLVTLGALAGRPPGDAATHVALAGAVQQARGALDRCEPSWDLVPEAEGTRWRRDRPLLKVAEPARAKRLEAAWSRFETT